MKSLLPVVFDIYNFTFDYFIKLVYFIFIFAFFLFKKLAYIEMVERISNSIENGAGSEDN